jgi:inhibitor of KinA
MSAHRFLDCGECAVSVEFGNRIDDDSAARVIALDATLAAAPHAGIIECVPSYRALMVHYDPLILPRAGLLALIEVALNAPAAPLRQGSLWHLPACYAPEFADDLPHIAASCGLAPQAVTALHAGTVFGLAMYGFAPGWAYLSGLPVALALPRRATPRDNIPAGSLIIAGGQAIVAALSMPSGWHILGRTPARLFDAARQPAFLLAPGDRVMFDPVDQASFAALQARAQAGEPLARRREG